jgi:hypothetical protein
MRKRVSRRPLRAFGKDHNKLIRQPTRTIRIEPMETHITIPPLEECIVLDRLIQRFLSWAHKAKAHPLACLPWILMHKEVQALLVDTTMAVFLARWTHMREWLLVFLHFHHHHLLCLRVSLCHPPPQDDDEEEPWADVQDPPGPFWVIDDRGRNCVDWKLVDLLCLSKSGGTGFPDLGGTGFSMSQPQYPVCLANSVAPVLAVVCSKPL